jgi:hypothetical protein
MAQSLSNRNRLLEKYMQVVREDGLNTNKNVNIGINGATASLWVSGNITSGGTFATGAQTITSTSANAFTVGPNGTTNPAFNIDASVASAATGLNIQSEAAAGGVVLTVTSSGSNETLYIKPKGGGSLIVQGSSGTLFAVGTSGGNNTLVVANNAGSVATGLKVTGAAAASGVALAAISTGTNENLTLDAKGSGTVTIGGTSTGNVVLGSTSNLVNFAQTAITATGASTAIFLVNGVGGTGGPTTAAQFGWEQVQIAGTSAWIPIWH